MEGSYKKTSASDPNHPLTPATIKIKVQIKYIPIKSNIYRIIKVLKKITNTIHISKKMYLYAHMKAAMQRLFLTQNLRTIYIKKLHNLMSIVTYSFLSHTHPNK